MSPVEMHEGEVRYYSSPIMVKNQQYTGIITSERLIIEGGSAPREFKITNIVSANPVILPSNEPGLKIVLSTQNGHKEMVWSFPVGEIFKAGEQQAWVDQIKKAIGEKPFAVPGAQPPSQRATATASSASSQAPVYSPGEMEVLNTAGIRIKRTYYTLYLTNLRLILQNASGQIGREFAIAELMDASRMESESGEPSIALTIGSDWSQTDDPDVPICRFARSMDGSVVSKTASTCNSPDLSNDSTGSRHACWRDGVWNTGKPVSTDAYVAARGEDIHFFSGHSGETCIIHSISDKYTVCPDE